jgi:hypothetical protein
LKVDTWWKKALDRNILGRIVNEDTVHKGLQSQRRKKKKEEREGRTVLGWILKHYIMGMGS